MLDVQTTDGRTGVQPGRYRFDPARSGVRMRIKGNWGLHRVRATFAILEGALRLEEDGTIAEATATIDPASFSSRNERRDRHIRSSDFLDVERFPEIWFAAAAARRSDDGVVLPGSVTIHGVTEPVEVRVSGVQRDGDIVHLEATATLERARFGVTHMPRRIGHDVELAFDVVATRV